MVNINDLKLNEIDYEIERINKELPHLELMDTIWELRKELPKGVYFPAGIDEFDFPLIEKLSPDVSIYFNYKEKCKKEKELRSLGLILLSHGQVTYRLEDYRETLNNLNNLRRKKLEPENTLASPPQDTPQGKKRNKLFYNYNKQDKLTLLVKKNKFITLTENEAKLFLFLAKDRRTQEEIAEHIWEVYSKKDIHTKKGNAMELRNRLNKKCSKIGIENLISTLIDGCYCLNFEVEER